MQQLYYISINLNIKITKGDYFEKNILVCWFFDGVYSI